MADLKDKTHKESVDDLLNGINDAKKRSDCLTIVKLLKKPQAPNR